MAIIYYHSLHASLTPFHFHSFLFVELIILLSTTLLRLPLFRLAFFLPFPLLSLSLFTLFLAFHVSFSCLWFLHVLLYSLLRVPLFLLVFFPSSLSLSLHSPSLLYFLVFHVFFSCFGSCTSFFILSFVFLHFHLISSSLSLSVTLLSLVFLTLFPLRCLLCSPCFVFVCYLPPPLFSTPSTYFSILLSFSVSFTLLPYIVHFPLSSFFSFLVFVCCLSFFSLFYVFPYFFLSSTSLSLPFVLLSLFFLTLFPLHCLLCFAIPFFFVCHLSLIILSYVFLCFFLCPSSLFFLSLLHCLVFSLLSSLLAFLCLRLLSIPHYSSFLHLPVFLLPVFVPSFYFPFLSCLISIVFFCSGFHFSVCFLLSIVSLPFYPLSSFLLFYFFHSSSDSSIRNHLPFLCSS